MVLKRIIRQYLNQHLPENIMPAQKLDRKAKKIVQNQNYFRYVPLRKRIKKADSYLRNLQIYPVNDNVDQLKQKFNQDHLKTKYHPFFKYIEQCSTSITHLEKSYIHHRTELCKDYFLTDFSSQLEENLILSNQWTGVNINSLTLPSRFYKLQKAKYYLYSLSQYKVGFARKYDRQRPSSIYKSQLMERKKLGLLYGNLSKKEIYRTIETAEKYRGVFRENVLRVLESRLDVILYRIGFFNSIPAARQSIIHRKILVNQQVVTIAHYQLKAGDVVSVDRKESTCLKEALNKRFDLKKVFKSNKSRLSTSWPFVPNRGVLKKIIKFATLNHLKKNLFQAAKKLLESHFNQLTLFPKWAKLRIYTKFLQMQHRKSHFQTSTIPLKWAQPYKTLFLRDKRYRTKKQKLHGNNNFESLKKEKNSSLFTKIKNKKYSKLTRQRKRLALCFDTIKRLKNLKTIATLARREYGIKLRDPLFSYKFITLLKNTSSPSSSHHIKKIRPFIGIKKPLHLEISYKTLTAIYLYSPQKIFFPVNLDIEGVKKSYY